MKKILVVDDDEDILVVIQHLLTTRGFDVHTHSIGVEVPEIVKFYQPDLILMDILLFGKSGTDICKELKHIHNIPILLFSANTKRGKAFAECGADGYIQKPFDIIELINTINSHIESYARPVQH